MEPTRRLALIATRARSNDLFQVATLIRAATALEWRVDVFFDGDAVGRLARDRIDVWDWSPVYQPVAEALPERLRAADFERMELFLRDAKEHGDYVTLCVSAAALDERQLLADQLTALVDVVCSRDEFDARTRSADTVLSF